MRALGIAGLLGLSAVVSLTASARAEDDARAIALKEIRAAMAARDLPAIKAKLAAAAKLKGEPAYETELNRLELLGTYVTQFWQAVDRAGKTMQAEAGIRELKLGPGRIHVGEPLKQFQGILTGVPQYVGTSTPLMADDQPRTR